MRFVQGLVAVFAFGGSVSAFRSRRSPAQNESSADNKGLVFDNCYLKDGSCPVSKMKGLTFVYPGDGKTTCFNGKDYAFAVYPAKSDKLLIHFGGGGGCWEKKYPKTGDVAANCFQWLAVGKIGTAHGLGAFNFWRAGNVFDGYSVVTAVYCGGGAHIADSQIVTPEKTHRQTDYWNVKAATDWALDNFGGRQLQSLVSIGVSAGSLGSAFWAQTLFSNFQYKKAAMIWDSYAGVFPEGVQGEQYQAWGVCKLPILSSEAKRRCDDKSLTVEWVAEQAIKNNPNVRFGSIQSKGDSVQRSFYKKVAATLLGKTLSLSAQDLERKVNTIFAKYKQYPNYRSYIVEGEQHCFTVYPFYFTTSTKGRLASRAPGQLNKWMGEQTGFSEPCRRRRRVVCTR